MTSKMHGLISVGSTFVVRILVGFDVPLGIGLAIVNGVLEFHVPVGNMVEVLIGVGMKFPAHLNMHRMNKPNQCTEPRFNAEKLNEFKIVDKQASTSSDKFWVRFCTIA